MTRERLPDRRAGETLDFDYPTANGGSQRYTATVGYFDFAMARPGEVFLATGKSGSDVEIATRDSAILLSLALQHGCDIETARKALLRRADGSAEGPVGVLLDLLAKEAAR